MAIIDKNTFGDYLRKVNDIYANKDKNRSLTDILNSFKQISSDYKTYSENNEDNEFKYSHYNFVECSLDEKKDFFDNELQLVECLVTNSIYDKTGMPWNWFEIYKLLFSDAKYATTEKANRKVVYSTSGNYRPIGEGSYGIWNGLQIIDIDIKDKIIADKLKPLIFKDLCKYNWFLGCCLSASGKSIHVWTKITPLSVDPNNKRVEYICNFRHKFSFVYITLLRYANKIGYSKDKILEYLDMAMCKPQQGIYITSDNTAYLNTNFKDLRLDVNFEQAFSTGVESIDWISHPDLKEVFSKLEWFTNDTFDKNKNINISNVENINERNLNNEKGKRHYKHAQRWQLANTLTSIYGPEKALDVMKEICKDTTIRELKGDIKTASIHNKPISIWAVKELNNQHGFKIKIKNSEEFYSENIDEINEEVNKEENKAQDPTKILNDKSDKIILHLKYNEYLSDLKNDILNNLSGITLLEAGAGYGKTEMIKAFKSRTLLILPFTSTIKAKVEASETTKDWLYYYGNKRPTSEELLGYCSMAMTIDKFSKLNLYELEQAGFKYIVIDESHLLFTSSYREVMSPTIQRLANCKAKVIMMTGTPTGELLFFPGIKHIKVIKEDLREKEFDIHMCPTNLEVLIEMCKEMAKDIIDGKKILYPTNKGNLYYDQITGLIEQYLIEMKSPIPLKAFYYKKSNYGEDAMNNINYDKTIGDNNIIFCTTYLSVGVDITDKYKFSVYFNERWIPQDIEQFANRLRNNDLYIKMYLPKKDNSGMPINYYFTQPLDLSFSQKDLMFARDLIKTCNDMLERNAEESRYNPLIQSMLSANKFLKYDETDCKYYIDETTYKLNVFEERYSDYSKQLEVLINGIKYYGYNVIIHDHKEEVSAEQQDTVKAYLKSCKDSHYDEKTRKTFTFLNHINDSNIDMYKEILKGSYELFKDDKYKEDRESNDLYVEDIEVLEKNLPIVVSLYKYYDCETIKDIYASCVDNNKKIINYAKLNRIRKFANIEDSKIKKRLDFPVKRFIQDACNFAKENPEIEKNELDRWLARYAAKYANSVKGLVIDDIGYLQEIYDLMQDLFKVIITQGTKHKGKIHIEPYSLLWEKKQTLNNIYGNLNTQEFFLQDINNNKEEDEIDEETPELEITPKVTLEEISDELPNIIHKEFDYVKYSEEDNSNNRFLRKQENTNPLRDKIFTNTTKEEEPEETIDDRDLFTAMESI